MEKMMKKVYVAGDNIVNSLGFSTTEVMRYVESGITGFNIYNDHSQTPVPLPLSLIDTSLLTARFMDILERYHPEMNEKHYTRLEKMFIISIDNALKEIERDIYRIRITINYFKH